MFDEALAKVLHQLEGARCVLLTGSDGMLVASAVTKDGPAPDVVAASLADLFRKAGLAHRESGVEPGAIGRLRRLHRAGLDRDGAHAEFVPRKIARTHV